MVNEKRTVYADVNASSPIKFAILNNIRDHLERSFGNPSNLHKFGQQSKKILEDARESVASSLNLQKSNAIIFTSGGTESNVLGVYGFSKALGSKIQQVLVSEIEHSSILGLKSLVEEAGFSFDTIAVSKDGVVDLEDMKKKLFERPSLVSVMLANNETGVIQPVQEIGQILHDGGHYFHCDAVQAFGKIPLDLNISPFDCLSLSGHKVGALKGVGALYVREGLQIKSVFGDGSHERSWRSGTENLSGIWSLGLACENFNDYSELEIHKNKFEKELKKCFGVVIVGEKVRRLGNTVCAIFPNANQGLLLAGLDMNGISASAGSACKASMSMPSHVLKAMGFEKKSLKSVIRFSFGSETAPSDFDYVLSVLSKLIGKS